MVENSLLDAYRKANILRKKIYEGQYHKRLGQRLAFYKQEGMTDEYYKTFKAIQTFEGFERSLDKIFDNSEAFYGKSFAWRSYFNRADQVLYDEEFPQYVDPNYYGTNDKLLSAAVEELNKQYPSDKWQLGDLPLYRWNILNYPGYETTEEDIEDWKSNPNVVESDGYYIESSVQYVKCIHSSGAKSILMQAKDDMKKLRNVCSAIKAAKQAYVVEDSILMDRECSGGYDLGLELVFRENATTTFYGTELTPVEQVINSTIVREIDTKLAGTKDMDIVHSRLDVISSNLKSFLAENNLKSLNEVAPLSAEEDGLIK